MKINRFLKSINQKVPLNRAIISDILLWFFLTALLVYGLYLLVIVVPNRRGQTIHLEFLNANEISRGAPVRLMGTDIGFVDNIRIKKDHVIVTVQTDPDTIQIPSGSVFTILFTGLGGAKSIEVSLPVKPLPPVDGKPVYRVKEPISMRDTLNASLDSVQALQKGSENISDFFGKRKPVEELQFNIKEGLVMSSVANRNTASLNKALESIQHDVARYTQEGIETVQGFNNGATILNRTTQPAKVRPMLQKFNQDVARINSALVSEGQLAHEVTHKLQQFTQSSNQVNAQLIRLQQAALHQQLPQWLADIEQGQQLFANTLNTMEQMFPPNSSLNLESPRKKVQQFNQQLLDWHQMAERWEEKGILKPALPTTTKPATPAPPTGDPPAGTSESTPDSSKRLSPTQSAVIRTDDGEESSTQASTKPKQDMLQPLWELIAFFFS